MLETIENDFKPGESVIANIITDNCGFSLRTQLNKKGYDTIRSDVRTIIKKGEKYRYPDLSVTKRSEITETQAITNPELLIEVSSNQSAKTDNETKLNEYITLPSVQYYLIISQYEMLVQLYKRDDQGWRFEVFSELSDEIKLSNLNCSLFLSDIYENVHFAEIRKEE